MSPAEQVCSILHAALVRDGTFLVAAAIGAKMAAQAGARGSAYFLIAMKWE